MDNFNKFNATEVPNISLVKTGKKLKELRLNANLTVEQLQKIFGFNNPTAIYKWEAGRCLPDINNMFVLKELYNVSLESIYELDDEPEILFLCDWNFCIYRIKLQVYRYWPLIKVK